MAKIQLHPNLSARTYHVRFNLGGRWSRGNSIDEWQPNPKTAERDSLKTSLSRILGIESIVLDGYHIHVIKGEAFEWSEIEPHILAALSGRE